MLAREHRVCAIDLIGFGRNRFFLRRSRLPLQFDEVAALLARWIESELREPAHIVGSSMGGHIALHLAATRPDVVRSLVLVNSTGVPFRVAPAEHLRNLFVPRGFLSFLRVLVRDVLRAGPASMGVALGRLLRDDARSLMRAIRVPVLLVWGEHDPLVPLRYALEMLRTIPNARLETIPHAAHVPMWESPALFNDLVLQFVNEVDLTHTNPATSVFSWAISGWSDGIAHRSAGRARDIVLVHGLGMSSAYFVRFASALFDDGWSPIAPDLPGFGESNDGAAAGPREHAEILARWADGIGIRNAIWVGHSAGCNAVAHLRQLRIDLVASAVCIGPLWRSRPVWLLLPALLNDAVREPLALFVYVARAYWRAGLGRWFGTFRRYRDDLRREPPAAMHIVGERDPLVDRQWMHTFVSVPGAHACHFSNAAAAADAIRLQVGERGA